LDAEDFQEMAELYMPESFKRTKELFKNEAMNLWIHTYKAGILTKEDLAEYEHAYEEDEGFIKNPKTEEEIAEMFGIELEKKLESTDDLDDDEKDDLYEKIANGEVPVIKGDDGEEYLQRNDGKRIKIGDELKDNVEYTSKTEKELHKDLIKQGKMPVIEKEGQEYLPIKGMPLFSPEEYGLQKGEYKTIPFDNYLRQMLGNGDLQAKDEVKPMELDMKEDDKIPIERPDIA